MCATNDLGDRSIGANHFSQWSNELGGRRSISKNNHILIVEVGVMFPSCTVKHFASECILAFDLGNQWLVQSADGTDQDSTFANEDLICLGISKFADPKAPLAIPLS